MVVKSFTYQGFEESGFEAAIAAPEAVSKAPVAAQEILPEAPKPVFTTDDMEVAKNLAHEEGFNSGLEQARQEFEAKRVAEEAVQQAKDAELLEKINSHISALNARAQESKLKISDKISQIALSIAKKVCGDVSDKIMETEISKILGESIQKLDADERIKIYASQKNAEYLNNKFTGMAVNIDPNMELGDFRIEWKNGYAQRDVKKLWKSIGEICGRHSSLEENEENEQ